jgi:endonuclease I
MKLRNSILVAAFLCCFSFQLSAQMPDNYYYSANGKSGAELKTALFHIIRNPNVVSYARIWRAFETTDACDDRRVWDIFSDNSFDFRRNRCGTEMPDEEGNCYSRKHLVPTSWFREAAPMHTDLFHIFPADGYVSYRRGNLSFGEVGTALWTSSNGSKIGQNTFGNYNHVVFEPIDEYKGDIARIFFYMVTAYEDQISGWRSAQIIGGTYPGLSDWSLEMFLNWHRQDPVSEKEIRRNEVIFRIQGNRNPFIDFPELAEYVWGERVSTPFRIEQAKSSHYERDFSPFEQLLQRVQSLFERDDD